MSIETTVTIPQVSTPLRTLVSGCPVDHLSFSETVDELELRIRARERTHIVFVNASKVVKYHSDERLHEVMDRAGLLLADGVPVVWASMLKGKTLPGRVNGTDLMEAMVERAAKCGFRVFFFGAKEEVVRGVVDVFQRRFPALQVAGYRNGYYKPEQEEEIVRQIASSQADLVFIAISTPRKELFGDKHLEALNVSVVQGVGGSFDVFAGLTKRAPVWMQRMGLEWFYRLLQEPGRMWRRYLVANTLFIWYTLRWKFQSRPGN